MRNDPEDWEKMRYVEPENLLSAFKNMGGSVAVTKGCFEADHVCEVRDAEWNTMDQLHRPCLHHTYLESLRLVTARSFALSLTRVGGFKWLTVILDVKLKTGLAYQVFTLFNLLYVHTVIEIQPRERESKGIVTWYIVSHPFFKFLHGWLSRRLYRLNEVQNEEDSPVRLQRAFLRRKGYSFGSDNPDFLNCNVLTSNVIFPKLSGTHRISLPPLQPTDLNEVSVGSLDLLVRKNPDQSITVWPAVCPHEGAPLKEGQVLNHHIVCRWHHLRQDGLQLSTQKPQGSLRTLRFTLEGKELVVQQADSGSNR